ncbi:MAG TPA: AmmeMemoRadiSam system radical SAM enzyme [Ktedonobacteraceae bacterium]
MHQALFAQALDGDNVECRLCAHYCHLKPGQTGVCQVRHNSAGALVTSAYGRPVLLAVEPIEKKFFFHVAPGSQTLSLGTAGCNLRCKYCINWRVSQRGADEAEAEVTPAHIVDDALARQVDCIAFTYTEPTIFFEYAQDIARLAQQHGLTVVAKSNGYMTPDVLREMASWLHAINIDLKGWESGAHQRVVGGQLKPILDNLRLAAHLGLWLEVTTLLVPGLSQNTDDLDTMARFIAQELGPDTPWHLLRFYPHYKMLDQAVTSQALLQRAVESGQKAGLRYIYCKELERGRMLHTYCPHCHALMIERKGYSLVSNNLRDGCCGACGYAVQGHLVQG